MPKKGEVQLTCGLQELGKEARLLTPGTAEQSYRDIDDEKKSWAVSTDGRGIRDVFPEDYRNPKVQQLADGKLKILIPGCFSVDENFEEYGPLLQLYGGKVQVELPSGVSEKDIDGSCKFDLQVVGRNNETALAKLKTKVMKKKKGTRSQNSGFAFTMPFLRVFVPCREYLKPHVAEVLLGVRVTGWMYPRGSAPKEVARGVTQKLAVKLGSSQKGKAQGDYELRLAVEGPDLQKIAGMDVMQILTYMTDHWGPQAMMQPEQWKILSVKVSGNPESLSGPSGIPPSLEPPGSDQAKDLAAAFWENARKPCELQKSLENGTQLPQLKLGKKHGVPTGVFQLYETLKVLDGPDMRTNVDAAEITWALKKTGDAFKDPPLERPFVAAVAMLLKENNANNECQEWATMLVDDTARLQRFLSDNPEFAKSGGGSSGSQLKADLENFTRDCRSVVALAIIAMDCADRWKNGFKAEDKAFLKDVADKVSPFPTLTVAKAQSLWNPAACRYLILEHFAEKLYKWDTASYFLSSCPKEALSSTFEAKWLDDGGSDSVRTLSFFHLYEAFVDYRDCDSAKWLDDGGSDSVRTLSFFHLYEAFVDYRDCDSAENLVARLAWAYTEPKADAVAALKAYMADVEVRPHIRRDFLVSFVSACRRRETVGQSADGQQVPAGGSKASKGTAVKDEPVRIQKIETAILEYVIKEFNEATQGTRGTGKVTTPPEELAELLECALLLGQGNTFWSWAENATVSEVEKGHQCSKFLDAIGAAYVAKSLSRSGWGPSFLYDDAEAKESLASVQGLGWIHDGRQCGYFSEYKNSSGRSPTEVGHILRMYFKLALGLGEESTRKFMQELEANPPPAVSGTLFSRIAPAGSKLRSQICVDVKRVLSKKQFTAVDIDRLVGYKGFFHGSFLSFLRSEGTIQELSRSFSSIADSGKKGAGPGSAPTAGAFAELLEAIVQIVSLRPPKGNPPPSKVVEDCVRGISEQCQAAPVTWKYFRKVAQAVLEIRQDDIGDFDLDAFYQCAVELSKASRLIQYKQQSGASEALMNNMGIVLESLMKESAPKTWVSTFRSLDTVVYVLEHTGMEDLGLTFEKFQVEGGGAMSSLLQCTKKIYSRPLASMFCPTGLVPGANLHEVLMKEAPALEKTVQWCGVPFTPEDWSKIINITGAAAEIMTRRYGIMVLPHHCQLITLLAFALRACAASASSAQPTQSLPKSIFARVGTGEGKSLIIGMIAAFVALKGMRAHVIHTYKNLTKRDYALTKPLFEVLGIKSGQDGKVDLKKKDCMIVYCIIDDVQECISESLTDGVAKGGEPYQDSLRHAVLIADEVDGLLIDGGCNQTIFCEDKTFSDKATEMAKQLQSTGDIEGEYDNQEVELQNELEDAWDEAKEKVEGRDYALRGQGAYMLNTVTGKIDEGDWTLWLEVLKMQKCGAKYVKYQYPKAIVSKLGCFMSYSCIFGLTGSLGQKSEKDFLLKQFEAATINVPFFLDTCRADGGGAKKKVVQKVDQKESFPSRKEHHAAIIKLAVERCAHVPVLIIVKDSESANQLADAISQNLEGRNGGKGDAGADADNVIRLLHNPKKPDEFLELVDRSVEPLRKATSSQKWRITVTTAEGGRGHDYRVVDPEVDAKGGLLLILTWVPWSEREWTQFLGRTARQDRKGQYVVYLNEEELQSAKEEKLPEEKSLVDTCLRIGEEDAQSRLEDAREDITKGLIMHQLSQRYWAIDRNAKLSKEQSWQWKKLCESYKDGDELVTQEKFDQIFPPGQDDQGIAGKMPQRGKKKKGKVSIEYFQGPQLFGASLPFQGDSENGLLSNLKIPPQVSQKMAEAREVFQDTADTVQEKIQETREEYCSQQ